MIALLPFILLLLLLSIGPTLAAKPWHKYYPVICLFFVAYIMVFTFSTTDHASHNLMHTFSEYVTFISMLAALYFATGGIVIHTDENGTPEANVILLLIGAILASFIGTTGAAMVLIRPFIEMNKSRLQPYQKIFFIFIVCNAGGMLSPIGDPPLFMGFIKGVPFFWITTKTLPFWILTQVFLLSMFYYYDKKKNPIQYDHNPGIFNYKIEGIKNIAFLFISLCVIFLDPNIKAFSWLPYIPIGTYKISFIRELILLGMAWASYRYTDQELLKKNEFTLEPIKEVAFIFIALFFTMAPALQQLSIWASHPDFKNTISIDSLYWFTGFCSSILDNAPSYLSALSIAMASVGLRISILEDVHQFIHGPHASYLVSISIASVLFGAFTYIGNAPNFMVKAVAEQRKLQMPGFIEYILKYSIPILIPVLLANYVLLRIIY